jgi:hypothetical protein
MLIFVWNFTVRNLSLIYYQNSLKIWHEVNYLTRIISRQLRKKRRDFTFILSQKNVSFLTLSVLNFV